MNYSLHLDILFLDEIQSWRKLPPDSSIPVEAYIHSLEIFHNRVKAIPHALPNDNTELDEFTDQDAERGIIEVSKRPSDPG